MNNVKKNSVLIADNEELNLIILDNILSPFYTVYKAYNGYYTIKTASNNLPDLILLDVDMPDMLGFDVLKVLKAQESTKNIPVIFITNTESIEDEEKGLALEASDFIYKPLRSKIIRSRVRNQIQIINQFRELAELHKDLEDAVKTAEKANKAKSAFLAKMSHEIRTPLNAVLGISEIQLHDNSLKNDTKEAFGMIYNSGDLLLGIINDILDMSKIETGKLELSVSRYDVYNLINDTVNLNIVRYRDKPIKFILNAYENIPSFLIGDEVRIKQILNNVLSNAFKYTKEGEIELSVKANKAIDENDCVTLLFCIRDTGQGMNKDQIEKLFDEYARFNQEANKMIEGVGLGMSITRSLVYLMGGEIQVESQIGKGSVFIIRLPQKSNGAPLLGKEAAQRLCRLQVQKTNLKKMPRLGFETYNERVLIVDDNETNIYVAQRMLSFYKLQIDTAASGVESIEKVKKNKYDIVFMDHMMPEMDGIEAVKEIRKLGGEYEKLPIIALSANAVYGMKELFLESGFNGFISKPIIINELEKILKEFLFDVKAAD